MGPSTTESLASTAPAVPPVPTAPPSPPRRPAGYGAISGRARVACAMVVAVVIVTNGTNVPIGGGRPGVAAGSITSLIKPIGIGDPNIGAAAPAPPTAADAVENEVRQILTKVRHLDDTVWKTEVEAQRYEEYFIDLWDRVRAAEDKFGVLAAARFDTLTYGKAAKAEAHDWGVNITKLENRADHALDRRAWLTQISALARAGYRLTEVEFHHSSFEHEEGQPARSAVTAVLHLVNRPLNSRTAVHAELKVEWGDQIDRSGPVPIHLPRRIDATEVTVADRVGDVTFAEVALPGGNDAGLQVDESSQSSIVYDLDNDGRSELVIPGENAILRNKGDFKFAHEQLLRGAARGESRLDAGVCGDFTGDGLGSSREDPVYKKLWDEHGMTPSVSWNAFEHDVLFMNEGGKGFLNVAHLMGVAFEADTRGIITEDFDNDGRMDLLVAEQRPWYGTRYLHVYKNAWPTKLNWIGVRLAESKPGLSPLGAEIRVHTAGGMQPARIVTGDSYIAQHAAAKHFGLGKQDKVEAIEVIWPNGKVTRVENPAINTWHQVNAAGAAVAPLR